MTHGATVNIRRDVDDKFYRYKMPVLLTKIEGKGNGIKTVLPNMADVARALSRPPTYPTKFFGCELGAQTSCDDKSERYIVNGAHDASRLRELLDAFIDRFVLCAACKNPETELVVVFAAGAGAVASAGAKDMKEAATNVVRDCKACGTRTGVDMRHKLVKLIVMNPPVTKRASGGRHQGHARKKGGETAEGSVSGGAESPARVGTPEHAASGVSDDDELVKKIGFREAELDAPAAAAAMHVELGGEESDEDEDSPFGQLALWTMEHRENTTPVEVYEKAQELGIEKRHKTVQVLVQNLFTENIIKEIPRFTPLFKKLATSQRHQKALLGGIERVVGVEQPLLIPVVPKILMAFYQADALEEDVIKQWGTHVSRKYVGRDVSKRVRKASEPFLKWLKVADEST